MARRPCRPPTRGALHKRSREDLLDRPRALYLVLPDRMTAFQKADRQRARTQLTRIWLVIRCRLSTLCKLGVGNLRAVAIRGGTFPG